MAKPARSHWMTLHFLVLGWQLLLAGVGIVAWRQPSWLGLAAGREHRVR